MSELLWATLLSLRIALLATALAALVAIPLAYVLARKRFVGKALLETVAMLPLILPPTVIGYILLATLGVSGIPGRWIYALTGFRFVFSTAAAVVAAAVVSFPLLLIPARAAFAGIDRELIDIARLLGASRTVVFFHVTLPLALRGIGAGLILAFARALGELGATVIVYGDIEGRRTLPISVFFSIVESGDLGRALPAAAALTFMSLILILLYNRSRLARSA